MKTELKYGFILFCLDCLDLDILSLESSSYVLVFVCMQKHSLSLYSVCIQLTHQVVVFGIYIPPKSH